MEAGQCNIKSYIMKHCYNARDKFTCWYALLNSVKETEYATTTFKVLGKRSDVDCLLNGFHCILFSEVNLFCPW